MPISIQQISYIHPDKEVLFSDLNFAISKGQKLGLVGNNGCGKSTLLQIIAGQLAPSSGVIVRPDDLYYIPQHFGQYDSLTIAQALQIDHKQKALHAILAGDASIENFSILNDDWNIEERSVTALDSWGLGQFPLSYPMNLLSGGEKTRVFLAGMDIHNPSVILMDEPTNPLGYFAVSFSLGIAARNAGLTPIQGFFASLFNNASAGEYAAFSLIAAGATYLEVAIITLIANARYLLMSCALAQKFAPGTPFFHRLIIGYDVTDELFGITIARPGYLNPFYTYGAIALAESTVPSNAPLTV